MRAAHGAHAHYAMCIFGARGPVSWGQLMDSHRRRFSTAMMMIINYTATRVNTPKTPFPIRNALRRRRFISAAASNAYKYNNNNNNVNVYL